MVILRRELAENAGESDEPKELREAAGGLRVFAPLFAALLRHPGLAADGEILAASSGRIMKLLQEVVSTVQGRLFPGGADGASRALLAAPLSELVGRAWADSPDSVDAAKAAEIFLRAVNFSDPLPEQAFDEAAPRATTATLMETRAVARVLPTLMSIEALAPGLRRLFWGDGGLADALRVIREDMEGHGRRLAERGLPSDVEQRLREASFRSALDSVSLVYGHALEAEFQRLGRSFKTMSDDDKRRYMEALPGLRGGPLAARVREQMALAMEALGATVFPLPAPDEAAGERQRP